MRILLVSPYFLPAARHGGPPIQANQLCIELVRLGCEVRVLTTDTDGPERIPIPASTPVVSRDGFNIRYCRHVCSESVSGELLSALPAHMRWADAVHLIGPYSFPTLPTMAACRFYRKQLLWVPNGGLMRWQGTERKGLKRLWEAACRVAAPSTMIVRVSSDHELQQSRRRFPGHRFAVIPDGVHVPANFQHEPHDENGAELRYLFLGRLDAIKGIENLLEACRLLVERGRNRWHLTIAGDGNPAYRASLETLVRERGLSDHVSFAGWVDDEQKGRLFARTDLLVLPSHMESFGVAIAEALARGVPVVASRQTPWQSLEQKNCGMWVDNAPDTLAEALERAWSLPLREMGARGRQWMLESFAWDRLAQAHIRAYQGLLD